MDNLLITGNNEGCIYKFKTELMKEFEMINLGPMTYFLGINFHKSKKRLVMHQRRHALEILKKFKMEYCNVAITPTGPRMQMSKNEHEQNVNPTQYRRMIGSLWYLCNTRLYFAFNVGIVRRFMERPNVSHLAAVKRILRYIKGSIGCKILFPATEKVRNYNLLGYTDFN